MDAKIIEVQADDVRNLCIILSRWLKTRTEPGRWSPEFEARTEKLRNRFEALLAAREEQIGFVNERAEEGKTRNGR